MQSRQSAIGAFACCRRTKGIPSIRRACTSSAAGVAHATAGVTTASALSGPALLPVPSDRPSISGVRVARRLDRIVGAGLRSIRSIAA